MLKWVRKGICACLMFPTSLGPAIASDDIYDFRGGICIRTYNETFTTRGEHYNYQYGRDQSGTVYGANIVYYDNNGLLVYKPCDNCKATIELYGEDLKKFASFAMDFKSAYLKLDSKMSILLYKDDSYTALYFNKENRTYEIGRFVDGSYDRGLINKCLEEQK